jgi:hypothetical protein
VKTASPDSPQRRAVGVPQASVPLFSNRLKDIEIQAWTKVPIDNELAIHVISSYFKLQYPLSTFFEADLLIEDLARKRNWFCSELLVNSLLCLATVS